MLRRETESINQSFKVLHHPFPGESLPLESSAWCLHRSADFFRTLSSVSTCDALLIDGRIDERHSRFGQHGFPFVVGPYRPF